MYVVEILLQSEAREYLPHFARHRVSELEMSQMTRVRIREVKIITPNSIFMVSNIFKNILQKL